MFGDVADMLGGRRQASVQANVKIASKKKVITTYVLKPL